MKLTITIFLSAVGMLLFFSCTKDNDLIPCENCIVVSSDSLQNQDTIPAVPIAVIVGQQATVNLSSYGNSPDSEFIISIGSSGDILYEKIDLNGQPLSWSFTTLSPGTYPVRVKQTNYVSGSPVPEFNFSISLPNGTINSIVPVIQVNNDAHEIDHSFFLQVNP